MEQVFLAVIYGMTVVIQISFSVLMLSIAYAMYKIVKNL